MDLALAPVGRGRDRRAPGRPGDGRAARRDAARLPPEPGRRRRRGSGRERHPAAGRPGRHRRPRRPPTSAGLRLPAAGDEPTRCAPARGRRRWLTRPGSRSARSAGRVRGARRADGPGLRRGPGDDVDYHPSSGRGATGGRIPVLVAVDPTGGARRRRVRPGPGSVSESERDDEAGSGCSRSIRRRRAGDRAGAGEACIARARAEGRSGMAILPGRRGRRPRLYTSLGFAATRRATGSTTRSMAVVVRPDFDEPRDLEASSRARRRPSCCCGRGGGLEALLTRRPRRWRSRRHARLPGRAGRPGDSDPRWSARSVPVGRRGRGARRRPRAGWRSPRTRRDPRAVRGGRRPARRHARPRRASRRPVRAAGGDATSPTRRPRPAAADRPARRRCRAG